MKIKIKVLKTITSHTGVRDNLGEFILGEIKKDVASHSVINETFAVAKLNNLVKEELKGLKVDNVVPFMLEWNKKLPLNEQQQYFGAAHDYTYDLGYTITSNSYEIINSFPEGNFLLMDLETKQLFPYKLERGFEIFQA